MSFKTVANLKDSVAAILSGVDLSNIDDLNPSLERAARVLVQNADVPEASGIQNITLFAGVYDYLIDDRIFGTAINDIRPQGISRTPWNFSLKTDQETFDRTKGYLPSGTMATFQFNEGTPVIRIEAPFPKQQIIIDPMNTIGTSPNQWVASGTASNLAVDSTDFYESPASLRFTMTGAGTGILTKTLQNSLSMSNYQGVGTAFLAIEIPSGTTSTNLSNIVLKLGSSSGNYDSVTATTGFVGAWNSGNWLLVAFDFAGATTTGTPDWSAIDYVQVSATTLATMTNFRVGGLFMSLPSPAQILYQSAAIFKPSGLAPLTTITTDADSIILSNPAYTIYEYECAQAILQQTGAGASDATSIRIDQILNGVGNKMGLYQTFRGDNPSQELRAVNSWYDINNNGYDGSNGGNYW